MKASIEQRKQQYSKQLAAYTLRQWNAVRPQPSSPEAKKPINDHGGLATPPDTDRADQYDADPSAGEGGKHKTQGGVYQGQRHNGNARKDVHTIDFATRKAHDGRNRGHQV